MLFMRVQILTFKFQLLNIRLRRSGNYLCRSLKLLRNINSFKHSSPIMDRTEEVPFVPIIDRTEEVDHFKESFKYFKRRRKPKDLSGVIDFDLQTVSNLAIPLSDFVKADTVGNNCVSSDKLGLLPHSQWNLYSLKGFDGFMYIKNPFTSEGQQKWIKKCLELYTRKPSITNLDRHYKFLDDIWSLQGDNDPAKRQLIDKLTWATFGYHYNWDEKVYDPENYCDFPDCLSDLAKHITSCLNFNSFKPEAAIVNFYDRKTRLGIHTDNSEDCLDKPIISISFGQTAIFLLGTKSKTDKPIPMWLRSGDIVILSGASRTAYHAVPSIIEESICNRYSTSDDNGWETFHQYIEKHRINISIRQVYLNSTTVPK